MGSTPSKLALLASLYFAQGLPYGFFSQAFPVFLRQQQVSLAVIGLMSLLTLPWSFKFIWAPLVDRFGSSRFGHRKSWIVPLQMLAALLLVICSWFELPGALNVIIVIIFLSNLVAATQDVATDGLAVDMLTVSERGFGNSMQVAGFRVGMIVGGGALLMVFDQLGWRLTFIVAAALSLLAVVPVSLHREGARHPAVVCETFKNGYWQTLINVYRQPGMLAWLCVIMTYKIGDAIGSAMVRPFLVDQGLSLTDIGWLLGTFGFAAGLCGALAGGYLLLRLGRFQGLLAFGMVHATAMLLYTLPAAVRLNIYGLGLICSMEHFASGLTSVALFTMMMDRCRPATSATDYTVQASTLLIVTTGLASSSGFFAEWLGYAGVFTLSGLTGLVMLLFPWFMYRSSVRQASLVPAGRRS
jgi:PAT family beta-lactamase induction signal transducer AmpG